MADGYKSKYLRKVQIVRYAEIHLVKCPKCGEEYEVERPGTFKIRAIGCKYCDCGFNVLWE